MSHVLFFYDSPEKDSEVLEDVIKSMKASMTTPKKINKEDTCYWFGFIAKPEITDEDKKLYWEFHEKTIKNKNIGKMNYLYVRDGDN